jgi:hypothetical protein
MADVLGGADCAPDEFLRRFGHLTVEQFLQQQFEAELARFAKAVDAKAADLDARSAQAARAVAAAARARLPPETPPAK